ncbi:MAG: tyrosine-type recombinase/integrase [Thermoanaerobaculia bacterium]|nr:tyrosine-type recombinase/integrase [Thermoanaerobaculia bacterium]
MPTTTRHREASPVEIYMSSLSEGSQGMRQCLEVVAEIISDGRHDAESFPWHEVTYRDTAALRRTLLERYKPASVNKMLSNLRGVLKQTWRLGLIDADAYHRAAAVENVRSSNLLSGRALEGDEITRLFEVCAADRTAKGARDAAILTVLYGCGLRRGELCRLEVEDFDPADASIVVQGKGRKQRTVYLTEDGCRYLKAWLRRRGDAPGALFCPIRQTGEIVISAMRGESLAYILRRRQEEAGTGTFSPHDLRRANLTALLDAGVDVFTVQKLAGHADPVTTFRYDRRGEQAKRRAVERLELPRLAA